MKKLWMSRLIVLFFAGSAFFWIYETYKVLRKVILFDEIFIMSLFMHVIFLVATLAAVVICYRFAFPFSKEKAEEFLENENEVRMIEEVFSIIKTLLERMEKTFPEGNLREIIQIMEDDRRKILTGRESNIPFSMNDFKKIAKSCDLTFTLAQEMIDTLEEEIKATGFISQKQQSKFLRRSVKYRQELATVKGVFEKYKSLKI